MIAALIIFASFGLVLIYKAWQWHTAAGLRVQYLVDKVLPDDSYYVCRLITDDEFYLRQIRDGAVRKRKDYLEELDTLGEIIIQGNVAQIKSASTIRITHFGERLQIVTYSQRGTVGKEISISEHDLLRALVGLGLVQEQR